VSLKHETKKEKIAKKRSIPAQIVFWLFVAFALYLFYLAFAGHTAP
jgi:hypothetical protein